MNLFSRLWPVTLLLLCSSSLPAVFADFPIGQIGKSGYGKTIEAGHKPATVQGRVQKVELLVGRTSIEAFINGGEISSTRYVLPRGNGLSVKAEGGTGAHWFPHRAFAQLGLAR